MKQVWVKPANQSHRQLFFDLRTESRARENSKSPPPTWEQHCAWYKSWLNDSQRELYVVTLDNDPIGYIRISWNYGESNTGEVAIAILEEHNNKGYATNAITQLSQIKKNHGKKLVAEIKATNTGSLIAFLKSGYIITKVEDGFVSTVFK